MTIKLGDRISIVRIGIKLTVSYVEQKSFARYSQICCVGEYVLSSKPANIISPVTLSVTLCIEHIVCACHVCV